jgi:hypothetical protein
VKSYILHVPVGISSYPAVDCRDLLVQGPQTLFKREDLGLAGPLIARRLDPQIVRFELGAEVFRKAVGKASRSD